MHYIILVSMVLLTACYGYDEPIYKVCGQPGVEGNNFYAKSIINGKIDKDYDCVVRLKAPTKNPRVSLRCSGVVVGNRTILTAGHCVKSDIFTIFVNEDYIGVSKNIHKHPTEDLAIVFTDQDLDLPIAELPDHDYYYYRDMLLVSVGYGDDYVNPEDTRKKYGNSVLTGISARNQIVTKNYEFSVCDGDSGGPLLYCNTVIGILSGSYDSRADVCDDDNAYYARVFQQLDWIRGKMEEFE